MSKHLNLWQELNQRQQLTLTAIYHADQKAEDEEAARWRVGWEKRPAAVWPIMGEKYQCFHAEILVRHQKCYSVDIAIVSTYLAPHDSFARSTPNCHFD